MLCKNCHTEVEAHLDYCPNCGARILNGTNGSDVNKVFPNQMPFHTTRQRNRYIAALLAFFTGTFGIQRFYLGRKRDIILGCIYLAISFTGISTLIGIIEGVYILAIGEDKFDFIYNYRKPQFPISELFQDYMKR